MSSVRLSLAAAAVLSLAAGPAAAQLAEPLPADLEQVGVTQKLDARLPLDLSFTDDLGRRVTLGSYFASERPVVLILGYYECPMLCTLVLDGAVDVLRRMDWIPGREFEIVTVSVDPREATPLARRKKQTYVEAYGRPEAAAGWHFLTGEAEAIRRLTDAVGFRYRYVEERGEYAHPALLIVLTPDGRVSRYLFGVQHDPRTVRLSLVEASAGQIGGPVDQFLLYCYRFDPAEGRYAPVALRIMRLGGGLVALVLGAALLAFWLRELRQKRLA